MVSLRVGHVTLAASERTCCRKSNGFVFAIVFRPPLALRLLRLVLFQGFKAQIDRGAERFGPAPPIGNLCNWAPALPQNARLVDPLAGVEGLEPPTPGFGDRCSSRLSYTPPRSTGRQRTAARNAPYLMEKDYSMTCATTPAPTVRPPSRMAKRSFSSMAIGTISSTSIVTLSPGITISVPSGSFTTPVTSVVRK